MKSVCTMFCVERELRIGTRRCWGRVWMNEEGTQMTRVLSDGGCVKFEIKWKWKEQIHFVA